MITSKSKEIKKHIIIFKRSEQFINGGNLPAYKTIKEKTSTDYLKNGINLHIPTKNEDTHIKILSPSNKKYNTKNVQIKPIPKNEVFGGSYLHFISLDQLEKGEWKLYMNSTKEDGYFSVIITGENQTNNVALSLKNTSTEEQALAIKHISYCGFFKVKKNVITHCLHTTVFP
ncbi:hypothetical protein BK720_08055 [Bacillus thuringiensis serovar brasilensis]|uniref:lipocalin-like domain-containing protein n=1 Tax=Bacillus cereus group TaxID=86661 RepID=UPI000A385E3B|nr:lipocalin-like domain-containing protein [Bacillus thuringiensis]MCU5031445.1 lipocalin-like domain-containing protein [Bacillus cereus]MRA74176.1 hypothetical protein [Bacillus thuringiensis]MRA92714.1 hypothetical protein [Bacillus thuringiensis]MRC55340.1 hypothetical protein [Bacillus thuringiensis]OTX35227.1 hypothetical protein BK720_08055 [Bacillus thuringiensis serovar brasilensis]